jgi:hypothetical protein
VIELLAAVFVGLGFAEFVAWIAIVLNYSVQASVLFRVLITILKGASMVAAFVMAYLVLEDTQMKVLGLDAISWLIVFFVSQLGIRWMLNLYVISNIWSRR